MVAVTLPAPFLITNSRQKSHESLRKTPLGNRTIPIYSESKLCLAEQNALRDQYSLATVYSVNADRKDTARDVKS